MNSVYSEKLVDEYLDRVKEKLPSWLREDEDESKEILEEMKEHIWDLAQNLAGGPDESITVESVQEAIARMGKPTDIAKEYKKRGTPKIYISAEWWAWYSKVVRFVLAILWGINILALVFSFGKPFSEIIGSFLGGLWNSTLYATIAVTLIFVALSMEGFLPKDFPDMFDKYRYLIKDSDSDTCKGLGKEQKPLSQRAAKRRERANGRARRAEERMDRTEERVHRAEEQIHRAEEWSNVADEITIELDKIGGKKKKNKPPISVGGCLSDGIFGILWAIFIIVQPIASINAKLTPEFLLWIQLTGFLSFSIALVKIFQAFVGIHKPLIQQTLLLFLVIAEVMFIPIYLDAIASPEILTIFSTAADISWDPTKLFTIVMWISVVGTSLGALEKLGKVFSYRAKLNRYYDYQE
jgi:hypothetical protein